MLLFLGIFLISLTSAIDTSWGTYKQNDCIDLSIVSDATSCIIASLKYPNSTIASSNITMTSLNGEFNYTSCDTNTLGVYQAKGNCDLTPWTNDFDITPSGVLQNVGILIMFIFVVLILFVLSFYKIFNSHSKVEMLIFSIFSYFLILILTYMFWNISENYLYTMEWIVSLSYILFLITLIMMFPFIISAILYLFYNMFTEKNMKELTDIGYSPEEARKFK